jgi:hypothetical protein
MTHALKKHLVLCAQVLMHSSDSGFSTSNLSFFGPKKHHLCGRNFMHNNNVETAVHKLLKQQTKLCKLHNFRSWKSNWSSALTSWGIAGTAFSIIFCRKSQLTNLNGAV